MSRIEVVTAAGLAVVIATVGAGQAGLLAAYPTQVIDDAAQLAGALATVVCCLWTARRYTGGQRAWRLWLALGMTFWSFGQVVWSWNQLFADRPLPSPSLADAGYLGLVLPALLALVSLPGRRTPAAAIMRRPRRVVVVLDGLVLVGALFVLTWTTSLGAVVRAGAATPFAFGVAVAYPLTDLMAVVIVLLLLANSPVRRAGHRQLVLLGAGLFAIAFSDSLFAYLVASGASRMPALADTGFIIGPALLALAAVTPPAEALPEPEAAGTHWGHLLLPYVPVAATCALIIVQLATGHPIDAAEIAVETAVVALLITRQAITLVENNRLLDRVTEGRERLTHRRDGGALAVLFLDLDDFKAVNDRYGHAAGDRLLRVAADRLSAGVRPGDTVARLGGDEFAVLLEGPGHAEETAVLLLNALRQPYPVAGGEVTVGASLGFVDAAENPATAEELVRRADVAMYAGKRGGKNTLVRYRLDLADESGASDLSQLLATALAEHRGLDVHYQPIVRLADGTVVAVEALARWTDPVAGPIPADTFIAVAERAGLVGLVDDFVLDQACRDAAAFRGDWAQATVHVNVSAARFGEADQEDAVLEALRAHDLAPHRLLLELTETARLEDLSAAQRRAARLTGRGVQLGLDDFGTGYNALHLLHVLPVDLVKLDRSLVVAGTARSVAVCRSIIAICTDLGIRVIAEGIESPAQRAEMATLGCGYGQGHLFGRPGPLAAGACRPEPLGIRQIGP
jgi:diguanylate cyclase (GGDEF)-like protein